jgi:bleomycin hydrolase
MPSRCVVLVAIAGLCGAAHTINAGEPEKDRLIYVEKTVYPVLEEMKDRDEATREAAAAKTEEILASVQTEGKARQDAQRELRVDLSALEAPVSPDAFAHSIWHFPPTPQYRTGTCWSFATTSFMESEIHRRSGREIKLSEMWGAYWEYVLKARGFVRTRGESHFSQGSQSAALLRVYDEFGVVPRAAYEGVLAEDGRFDHDLMVDQMSEFLDWCREVGFWDEETIIGSIRLIMDSTMGRPPEQVSWQGRGYTPKEFLNTVCQLDPTDYVSLISTSSIPFWTRGEYAVPDNWWHDASYLNVPLETWFDTLKSTVVEGGSLVIGGDVSEPGLWGLKDVAIVPTFDIPGDYIDQDSREFRFVNRSSTDDHLIHVVGTTRIGDHDWFLIKDSNRSSRLGAHEGYYFYREDYVRLKMLMYTVHKDRVADLIAKVDES